MRIYSRKKHLQYSSISAYNTHQSISDESFIEDDYNSESNYSTSMQEMNGITEDFNKNINMAVYYNQGKQNSFKLQSNEISSPSSSLTIIAKNYLLKHSKQGLMQNTNINSVENGLNINNDDQIEHEKSVKIIKPDFKTFYLSNIWVYVRVSESSIVTNDAEPIYYTTADFECDDELVSRLASESYLGLRQNEQKVENKKHIQSSQYTTLL